MKRMFFSVLLLFLAACGGRVDPPPSTRPVIIPETTKVADEATRAALMSFEPDTGAMRFAQSTALLQSLEPDDVLVGEPSSAAPAGYLRKVKVIREEGSELVLETTQANLTDAVTQGEITEEGEFTADDVSSTATYLMGVTAEVVRPANGLAPQVGVGDNYNFRVGFDEVALDLGEGDVQVKVRLNGELYFNAGWGVDLGIEPCFEVPPVCVDRFEAKIGVEEWLKVGLSGEASAKLTKEVKVASYYFKPLVFFIGPVPVVVVPSIEVFVGASGEVKLSFSYSISQSARAQLGARWTEDRGWEDITGFDFQLEGQDEFNLNATMNARAYARALASLKFYDVAGPALGLVLAAEIDGAIPRDPTWIARGVIEGYLAFVVGLPVLGTLDEYRTTLFKESIEFSRSPNQAPTILVQVPQKRVELGQSVNLGFFRNDGACAGIYCVFDPEEGTVGFTLTSDLDGPLQPTTHTFPTAGLRTITVRATDSKGASSSASFKIDVVNTPPVAYGSVGSGTVPQTVPYFISAAASDPNSKLDCSALAWSVTAPDTIEPFNIGADVCYGRAVFNVTGERTVTLTARDPQGATSPPRSFTVLVTEPPVNPPPNVTQPLSVRGCRYFGDCGELKENDSVIIATLDLSVAATDPDGVTYIFTAQCFDCQDPGLNTQREIGRNLTGTLAYQPPQVGTWVFGARVTDGFSEAGAGHRTLNVIPVPPR